MLMLVIMIMIMIVAMVMFVVMAVIVIVWMVVLAHGCAVARLWVRRASGSWASLRRLRAADAVCLQTSEQIKWWNAIIQNQR